LSILRKEEKERDGEMKLKSQALLEYGLALGFALLIAVIVFAIVLNIAIHGGRLVSNWTEKVLEELEEMRTSLIG